MRAALRFVSRIYTPLVSNIAFIPTLFSILSLILAIVMLILESENYTGWLHRHIEFALVKTSDNARMVLATIIGGIISLTVFSFSMVMVVLNRASSSLSPRVLPKLIARKSHQVVLGYYMSTIIFSLILIINLDDHSGVPSLSILISMLAAVGSLGLFIYFIHSISQSIQVQNILHDIFTDTTSQIKSLHAATEHDVTTTSGTWYLAATAPLPGHHWITVSEELLVFLEEEKIKLRIDVYSEQFVLNGHPIIYASRRLEKAEIEKHLSSCIKSRETPPESSSFYLGFQQISEIAVKALSPAINDPATAIRAINLMTRLFHQVKPADLALYQWDEDGLIATKVPDLKELLHTCVVPIENCIDGNTQVFRALLYLYQLLEKDGVESMGDYISNLKDVTLADVTSDRDAAFITSLAEKS